jgi:acyl-CoA synthetase (NDP forming)
MKHEKKDLWQYLFSPETIAVIGASNTSGSWGNNTMRGLLATKGRKIYPVNPRGGEILGLKAYRSVGDIPGTVDLAVIVVGAPLVTGVLGECASKGVRTAVVISSGFGETGEEGRKLEDELTVIARRGGMRFIGPNSMGHADTRSRLSTFGQAVEAPGGRVAVLSQSGNICIRIIQNLKASGITLSKYVSTGNEADLRMEDFLEYLGEDDETGIIAAYIEGLRDGRRFMQLAKEITVRKPIVVLKVGGTEESARAVLSHTGALAGADEVYDAAFKQSGVIRVDDDEELCEVVYALHNCPLPRGNRVGILSIGGGPGALTAESCVKEGLAVGELGEATLKKLDKHLPPRWPRRNPVDMAGPSVNELSLITDLLLALLEDNGIDAVFLLVPIVMERAFLSDRMGLNASQIKGERKREEENLKLIREKSVEYGKPVFVLWQSRDIKPDPAVAALYRREKIPVQTNPRRAARIMHYLTRYRRYLDAVAGE